MTVARTIALFRNDIMITIRDTERKMSIVHPNNPDAVRAEVEHRLGFMWGVTLADMGM